MPRTCALHNKDAHYRVLANGRLASMYPLRGVPVVRDGVVYFAASAWPFLGTFLHALDAQTGKPLWSNSGSGAIYILQPHAAPSFAGVAPQGYLIAAKTHLPVPGGRAVPAAYDRASGRFLWHNANTHAGGYDVAANEQFLFNDGRAGLLRGANGPSFGMRLLLAQPLAPTWRAASS